MIKQEWIYEEKFEYVIEMNVCGEVKVVLIVVLFDVL